MQQTAKHARTKRPGLIRRLVERRDRGLPASGGPAAPPDVVDLAGYSTELVLERIERLERGMELLAQTMKATYGRLTESVEDARRRAARGASMEQVRRVVSGVTVAGGPATVGTPRPGPSVVLHGADASDGPVDALTALRRARFAGEELEAVSAGEP